MKRTTKNLSLNKQTIRVLGHDELAVASGGTVILKTALNCNVMTWNCAPTILCGTWDSVVTC